MLDGAAPYVDAECGFENSPHLSSARRGRAWVSRVVAVAIVGLFGIIALTASRRPAPVDAGLTVELPPPNVVVAVTAPPARVSAAVDGAGPELVAEVVALPQEIAVDEAMIGIHAALTAAPSACIRLRTNAPATLRIDGVEVAVLEPGDDGVWTLPGATGIPRHRPLLLTVVGPGVAFSQELADHGPVDLELDLQASSAEVGDEEDRPRRRRSSRSRSSDRSSDRTDAPTTDASSTGSGLRPPVVPRTR